MGFKQVYAFIARDLKIFLSDKTALFWLIAWPLIWIILSAYLFVPPSVDRPPIRLTLGLVNLDSPPQEVANTSLRLAEVLSAVEYKGSRLFDVRVYDSEEKLVKDLKQGRIDVGVVIPANFSLDLFTGTARLRVLVGARDLYTASISYSVVRGFLDEFSRRISIAKANMSMVYVEKSLEYINQTGAQTVNLSTAELLSIVKRYIYGIASPLEVEYEEVKPEVFTTREKILGWLTVGAIGMMFLYSGFAFGAETIYRERAYGTLRRVLSSPIAPHTLVIALILSQIIVMLISAAILLIGGVLLVGASITFNPYNPLHWLAVLLLITSAYISIGIGLALSLFAKTAHGASSLGTALGLLLAFTTGVWFPRAMLPQWLQMLADYSPITWAIDTVRNILVFNVGFSDIWLDLVKILFTTIAIIVIDMAIYRTRLRKVITSY